ncbi:hypothetical protein [Lentzea nigeriaca]|uniref:hypothetical protein n=1 Tax=Lentzea nigeriaca TaxID=1128665 RepID=UPI00195DDBD1|nr:hypothetical protein [Lentzea nigeriaca]MBM7862921.1 putative membrane protein YdfJ with MMPL/SSD domain [Lentzea nigeriaca]
MTRERLETLADALLVGVFVFVASLPVVTAHAAFGAGCAVLRGGLPVRRFWTTLRVRWVPGVVFGVLGTVLVVDVILVVTVLPAPLPVRGAVLLASAASGALLLEHARLGWRGALKLKAPRPMLMAALVVAGVLVWALPPLALVIAGPLALAAESTREG